MEMLTVIVPLIITGIVAVLVVFALVRILDVQPNNISIDDVLNDSKRVHGTREKKERN